MRTRRTMHVQQVTPCKSSLTLHHMYIIVSVSGQIIGGCTSELHSYMKFPLTAYDGWPLCYNQECWRKANILQVCVPETHIDANFISYWMGNLLCRDGDVKATVAAKKSLRSISVVRWVV